MSKVAEHKIVVLFEDELRVAALALKRMEELAKQADVTQEDYQQAWVTAYQACWAALYHLATESGDFHVTIAAKSMFKFKKS